MTLSRVARRFALTSSLALLASCGAALGDQSPEAAVASLSAALRNGDVDGAYSLMSRRYRERVSVEEFRALFDDHEEIARVADLLAHRDGAAEEEAVVVYGVHEELRLAREGGRWRVLTDVVDYYGQRTPRQTVRSFMRAIEARRWDVLLRLLPVADREGMTEPELRASLTGEGEEALDHLAAALRSALDADIEENGDHAVLPYGERFRMELVREGDTWHVADPD
jgi:hypothetical protein